MVSDKCRLLNYSESEIVQKNTSVGFTELSKPEKIANDTKRTFVLRRTEHYFLQRIFAPSAKRICLTAGLAHQRRIVVDGHSLVIRIPITTNNQPLATAQLGESLC